MNLKKIFHGFGNMDMVELNNTVIQLDLIDTCYDLNFSPNSCVEMLTPDMIILRGGPFGSN